ncbi:cyanate lyase [Kushneria sinocarnis]|uniref:Cyanate hydratase n=1 Tax=Kushneria sinocarnis TaxID=595502 RepID=A0A420WX56_9GAMM|nr:cyanase [Kushneria sinocarnis]RKR04314.1 cyanate lyase [Kushneria sinocarnis]
MNAMHAPLTEVLLETKREKGLTWAQIGERIGTSPIWVASVAYGNNSAPPDKARAIAEVLELDEETTRALSIYPTKNWEQTIPTDPLIYRFYEIMGVYGEAAKDVIQEEFGDGIMSGIDFEMDVHRQQDPKGDRVVITLNGKFLPYRAW